MFRLLRAVSSSQRPNNDQISRPPPSEFYGQFLRNGFIGAGLRRLKGVGVDVQRGGSLAMSQGGGYGLDVLIVVDEKGRVQVPELVDSIERKVMVGAKLL